MKKLLAKLFPVLAILAGIYWIAGALEYGLWIRRGPGGGFMPMFAGVLAIIFALWVLIAERSETPPNLLSWKACLPIAALIGLVIGSYVIGLILSIAVFVVLWLKLVENYEMRFSLITGVICAAVLYGIFGAWLQVPLPLGLFELLY